MGMTIKVEVNSAFARANDIIATPSRAIALTPPLDGDYWAYRVKLKHGQAIVAFPKFFTIGCGFAMEETDWNTNLPISCPTMEIFNHIKCNKKYKDIKNLDCIAAIEAIKAAIAEVANGGSATRSSPQTGLPPKKEV
jgi:hypothetical protein